MWAKLAAVRAACAIEYCIDAELRSLSLQAKAMVRREENMVKYSSNLKLPSWLDLKSLGMEEIGEEQEPDDIGGTSGGVSLNLEHGMGAWRDLTALAAIGVDDSLDLIAV